MKTIKFLALTATILFSSFAYAQTAGLGNKIWWDLNNNGTRDSGEPWAGGVGVTLFQDNDDNGVADAGFTPLTTTTDGSGAYAFNNLAAGKYFIRVGAGWNHYMSTVYGGDPDNDIDNDHNGFSQNLSTLDITTQTITLQPGTEPDGTATNTNTNNTCDVGMWKGNGLGDLVWLDNNGNGKQDSGEPGMANVTVNLRSSTGSLLATAITDAAGMYFFHDPLQYGTANYQIEFVTPAGYKPTHANRGGDDAMDSDAINGFITGVNVPQGQWNKTFDAGFVPSGMLLPVTLISFTAQLQNDKVELKWITATEINTSHFIVEKSIDGKDFSEAGMVFAGGNTVAQKSYTFTDAITGKQDGVIYYRLVSYDIDGQKELSETRIVRLSKQNEQTVSIITYPNPVADELRITLPAGWQNKKVVYEIFMLNGKTVKKTETPNSSQTETINISNLASGMYIIRVSAEGQAAQQKIIKQ
jgi:hypothetical protein